MNKAIKLSSGFTLLELLVAISILVVVSAMSFAGLSQVISATETNQLAAERLTQLEKTFYWMSQDFGQVVARPAIDHFGDVQPAFLADISDGAELHLTRSLPLGDENSTNVGLQRIQWYLEDGKLLRSIQSNLDEADEPSLSSGVMLSDVEQFEFQVFYDDRWVYSWPLPDVTVSEVPEALKITIQLKNSASVTRLFRLVL